MVDLTAEDFERVSAEELAAVEAMQAEIAAEEDEDPLQQHEPAVAPTVAPAVPAPPKALEDLFSGELPAEPWQHKRYSPDNKIWQAAAMRKRQHSRRSNVSLGVCTVDLSGPHEPSPRPGKQIHRDTATFFLVLTIRPDRTAAKVEVQTQTDSSEPADAVPQPDGQPAASEDAVPQPDEQHAASAPRPSPPDCPLIYAALLGSKPRLQRLLRVS